MRPFERHVQQPITVCFVQRFRAWKCRHNNRLTCFKDSMPWTMNISHTFEKPAFIWSWSCHHSCKHDSFLLFWGVWRHGIFVSSWRTWHTRLPEILYNSTNHRTTSKLLKCFHFSVLYASGLWARRLRLRLGSTWLLLWAWFPASSTINNGWCSSSLNTLVPECMCVNVCLSGWY